MVRLSQLGVVVMSVLVAVLVMMVSPCGAQIIDDFESYANNAALNHEWSGSQATLSLDDSTESNGGGTQSMRYSRQDVSHGSGSGVTQAFATPVDWSGETLTVWVRRASSSASMTGFAVFVGDNGGGSCMSSPFLVVSDTDWHVLSQPLASCSSGSFDASSVAAVGVMLLNLSGSQDDIVVNIDDMSLDGSVPVELLAFEVQ